MGVVALVAAVAGGVIAISSRGDSANADLIAAAGARAGDADSLHAAYEVTVAGRGEDLHVQGDLTAAEGRARITFDLPGGPSIEMLLVDGVMYVSTSGLGVPVAPGVAWMRLDLRELGLSPEEIARQFGGAGQMSDPASILESLQGVSDDAREVGPETINGVATTRYHADVDTDRAIDAVPPGARDRLRSALDAFPHSFPVDVWIDDEGLPRRIEVRYEAHEGGEDVAARLRMDFLEYGIPVDVAAPPAESTADVTSLLSGLGLDLDSLKQRIEDLQPA
jgi:hypothetical protein